MVVAARSRNPKVGQSTTNFLKSKSGEGGMGLSIADMHGTGLSSKKMRCYFK